MHLKYKLLFLVSFLFITSVSQADNASERGKMLAIDACSSDPSFYCTQLHGSALKPMTGITARFDTGDSRLVVPIGCVNKAFVKVIDPSIKDPWGNDAMLVEGEIALRSTDGSKRYVLHNFPFYALTQETTCSPDNLANLGAAPLEHIDQGSTGGHCIDSFFNTYNYKLLGVTPGFTLIPANPNSPKLGQHMLLKFGAEAVSSGMYTTPLLNQTGINAACAVPAIGKPFYYPNFNDENRRNFGFVIPDATLSLQKAPTDLGADAQPINLSSLPDIGSMLDTGGGMLIINDQDGKLEQSLAPELVAPPSYFTWLQGCYLIRQNYLVSYTATDRAGNTIYYQYSTVYPTETSQEHSAAVCPRLNNIPWILQHGANVGYGFFSNASKVIFNLDDVNGGFIGVSTPPSS